MRLIIDIPEHIYEHAKEMSEDSRDEFDAMRAIANGSQQRTGRWKFKVFDANRIGHYECSECHWNVLMNVSAYCPHCGAKMEVKE